MEILTFLNITKILQNIVNRTRELYKNSLVCQKIEYVLTEKAKTFPVMLLLLSRD